MTLTFHALWMLCGLAAAVFATFVGSAQIGDREHSTISGPAVAWIALLVGFTSTSVWLGSGRAVDEAWIGGLVAAAAATQLVRPRRAPYLAAASGGLAALWAGLIHVQGLALPVALAIGAALALAAASLSQRSPAFAPPELQEEALIVVVTLGLIVAVAPKVSQGWQSALALNLADTGASMPVMPTWMVCFVGTSITLGGLWSLWRRG